jgi:phosphomannomutase
MELDSIQKVATGKQAVTLALELRDRRCARCAMEAARRPVALGLGLPALRPPARGKPPVVTIDEIRARFKEGWRLVRASNTQLVLVSRYEAHDPHTLDKLAASASNTPKDCELLTCLPPMK